MHHVLCHLLFKEKLQLLTRRNGVDKAQSTWVPVNHFIQGYLSALVQYCRDQTLAVDFIDYLSPLPTEVRPLGARFGKSAICGGPELYVCRPMFMECHVGDVRLRYVPC